MRCKTVNVFATLPSTKASPKLSTDYYTRYEYYIEGLPATVGLDEIVAVLLLLALLAALVAADADAAGGGSTKSGRFFFVVVVDDSCAVALRCRHLLCKGKL